MRMTVFQLSFVESPLLKYSMKYPDELENLSRLWFALYFLKVILSFEPY